MMNSYYLDKKNLEIIGREFSKIKIIRLEGFIEENLYETLKREIGKNKFSHKKVPDKFTFSESKNSKLTNQILGSPELEYIVQNKKNLAQKLRNHQRRTKQKGRIRIFLLHLRIMEPDLGRQQSPNKKRKNICLSAGRQQFHPGTKRKRRKRIYTI